MSFLTLFCFIVGPVLMSFAVVDYKDNGSSSTNHPDPHLINFLARDQNSDENISSGMND